MTANEKFSLDGARAASERDDLRNWVGEFLASPGSDNAALGEKLTDEFPWWLGPLEVPIDRLHRLAGPPGEPVLCPVDEDYWRDDVEDLEEKVRDGWEPPPVIASYSDGQLSLEDGNHRVEGLRRSGTREAWTVIGFGDAAARDDFELPAEANP